MEVNPRKLTHNAKEPSSTSKFSRWKLRGEPIGERIRSRVLLVLVLKTFEVTSAWAAAKIGTSIGSRIGTVVGGVLRTAIGAIAGVAIGH
ncbi:hypothetical protein A3L04_01540 [Thermococcus chitonophagus]|uniref:Uncharacterized protein n=1 Tax=Thermococcus chitonophagus TaxID=54262 RepID=A0A2Z2N1A5_9EURY|nr:hypothetical protein A3L04_01540 [Thermococcus chitonophagus]